MMGLKELENIFQAQIDSPKDPYVYYNIHFAGVDIEHKHLSHELNSLVTTLREMKVMETKNNIPTFTREGV